MISQPVGFDALTKTEQIRYLQDLWDRILDAPGDVPVPDSHIQLALGRLAAHRADPSVAPPAREIFDRLAAKQR